MAELAFIPAFSVALIGMLVGQEALRRRTQGGIERERLARKTVAWWAQRFHYRPTDFTREGLRFWRAAQVLQLGAVLWIILVFAAARTHV